MIRRLLLLAILLLAACSAPNHNPEKINTYDVEEPDPNGPQIAYSYTLDYRLDPDTLPAVHQAHLKLCHDLTRARCIVMEDSVTNGEHGDDRGNLRLLVDARLAPSFDRRLGTPVTASGGALQSHSVTAEDVTRQVIDVEAQLRAKQALSDRLLKLIQTGGGSVGDLVAAEKAYAQVQQELDAARSQRADLRRRVAMSEMRIGYTVTPTGGIWSPIRLAVARGGDSFAVSAAAAITFVIAATPWLAIVGPAVWLLILGWRRFRRWRAARPRA